MRTDRHVVVGAPSEPPDARRVITVIGIDGYTALPRLKNAVSDAKGVRELFVNSFGFQEPVPPLFNEAATKEAIEDLIEDQLRKKLRPNDELILFFAGHGCTREERIGPLDKSTSFIAPVNAQPEQWKTKIKVKNLLDSINSLDVRCALVILDACNSGLHLDDLLWTARSGTDRYKRASHKLGRKLLASARKDQLARDDGPVPNHSLFTGTLIRGLQEREVDWDQNGFVTCQELGLYVEQRVAQATEHAQTPGFGCFGQDKGGELFIPLEPKATDGQIEHPGKAEIDRPLEKTNGRKMDPKPERTSDVEVAAQGLVRAHKKTVELGNSAHHEPSKPEQGSQAQDSLHAPTNRSDPRPRSVTPPERRRRSRWPMVLTAACVTTLTGFMGWWAFTKDPQPPNLEPEDIKRARNGILLARFHNASERAKQAHDAFYEALGGNRGVDGALPVIYKTIPPMNPDSLVDVATEAGAKVVVLVDEYDQVLIRSISHHSGNLLAELDGLELPTDPAALVQLTPVLEVLVGSSPLVDTPIPVLNHEEVGPRWAVLAEWLRVAQGTATSEDHQRLDEIRRALQRKGAGFYRDLAELLWAGSSDCRVALTSLRELSSPNGAHNDHIRIMALLGRAGCLLEERRTPPRLDEAEGLLVDAFRINDDPCVRISAIGSISYIDQARGNDALWNQYAAPQLHEECETASKATALSVRAYVLAEGKRWCEAADASAFAYAALRNNVTPLLNWAEYEWACNRLAQTLPRQGLLDALTMELDSERLDQPEHRVSIAYLRWLHTQSTSDARRVLDAYSAVAEGQVALAEGVASHIETDICKDERSKDCSRKILARPKRRDDDERLRRSLGI